MFQVWIDQNQVSEQGQYGTNFPMKIVQNSVSNFPYSVRAKPRSVGMFLPFIISLLTGILPYWITSDTFFFFLVFPGRVCIQCEDLGKPEMLLVAPRPDGRLVISL